MLPCVGKRKRSWKSYLGGCCCLLAVTYLTFQALAWFVIGPQEEYELSRQAVRAIERVTSGVHFLDMKKRSPVELEAAERAEPSTAAKLGKHSANKRPAGKRSALVQRFGSRSKLLDAIRRVKANGKGATAAAAAAAAAAVAMAPRVVGPAGPGHPAPTLPPLSQQQRKQQQKKKKKKKRRRGGGGGVTINPDLMKLARANVARRRQGTLAADAHADRRRVTATTETEATRRAVHRSLPATASPRGHPSLPATASPRRHPLEKAMPSKAAPAGDVHRAIADSAGRTAVGNSAGGHRVSRLRGVRPSKRHLYDLKAGATFQCLDGKGQGLPLGAINDEYCDCGDGSDEPGTSACSNGRFFCAVDRTVIFSSRVDDGRCDCCDGSDEREPTAARCHTSSCADLERQHAAKERRRERALSVRGGYVAQGRREATGGDFGPDSAFWPLSEKCLTKQQGEYKYDVCPFKSAAQSKRGTETNIGTFGEWKKLKSLPTVVMLSNPDGLLRAAGDDGPYLVLRMDGGRPCPGGLNRALQIAFSCDVDEALVAIGETEKCLYSALISTPAACHPASV